MSITFLRRIVPLLLLSAMAGIAMAGDAHAPASLPAPASAPLADPFAGNACVDCHRNLPGRSSEIVELEWKQSVHHAANVGCEGCHGGDASVARAQFSSDQAWKRAAHQDRNPEFLLMKSGNEFASAPRGRSVSYFCGRCHARIKEQHLGSPHGEFGDPSCLFCHGQGSHKITHPTADIIDTRQRSEGGRCSPCHRSGTMQSVARIKTLLIDTEEQIKTSGQLYKQLEEWGYRSLELEKLHHHANEVRSQQRQIFHSFNLRDINNFAAEIQGSVERTTATFELVQRLRATQRQQTRMGLIAVTLLLTFAGLLVYYKHAFLDHHDEPPHEPTAEERKNAAASETIKR